MKKILLLILGAALCLESLAQGVKAGPWVSEARTDRVTILWTSEQPGLAYVELADGTKVPAVQFKEFLEFGFTYTIAKKN